MRKHIWFPRFFLAITIIIASVFVSVGFSMSKAFYSWFFMCTIATLLIAGYFTTHKFIDYWADRKSMFFHALVAGLTYVAMLLCAICWPVNLELLSLEAIVLVNIAAIFFAASGLALMIDAIVTLKRILRPTNATVVDTGAYALVHHPQHLSILMIVFASLLPFSLPAALLACAGFYFWLRKAAQLEEHQFLNSPQTAEAYRAYAQSTPALAPTLQSLKKYLFLK